jgi:competence protein ComEC
MLLVNPQTLHDVGFQLSAMATLGLILFVPGLTAWLTERWTWLQGGLLSGATNAVGTNSGGTISAQLRGMVVDAGVMTVAATLLTLPLVAYHFGRVSVLGVLVNLLVVPVQPLILVAGTVGILSGFIGLVWVAQALLWVVWLGLSWTLSLVNWAAQLPATSVQLENFGLGSLLVCYALIAVGTVATQRKQTAKLAMLHPARVASAAGLFVLAVIASLVWAAISRLPDGQLHLYFLDVGQGDGLLIETPSGRQVLVDGGANREQLFAQLGEVMPWWDRSLDMVVATHPDLDHIGAQMTVPERFAVDHALDTPAAEQDPEAQAWREVMAQGGALLSVQHGGGWVDLGDGVALWVLWPMSEPLGGDDASNENSLVMKVVYGDFSVLLTGDAGIPSESAWLARQLPLASTVLKVGHHGSATGTSRSFVAAVDPRWAVIQVGADNSYGHPTPEVLDALAGRTILRNDEAGRIHFATDGRAVWIETER